MKKSISQYRKRWADARTMALVWVMMAPLPAFAQGQNQTQVNSMVQSILNLLTGPIAKGIAAIALVVAGYLFFFGQGNKGLMGSIIIGCFIVFGAGWIVDTISGT